jgi:hypothetical protein
METLQTALTVISIIGVIILIIFGVLVIIGFGTYLSTWNGWPS